VLEQEYKDWLTHEGFQPSTIATAVASTRNAEKRWANSGAGREPGEDPALKPYKSLLKRYSRFLHSIPFPRWAEWERFVVDNYEATLPTKPRGASTKPALTAKQWQALVATVRAREEPADEVLCLMLSHISELEPRAILKMELKAFDPAFSETLAPMKKKRIRFLWSYISSTPYGALARVQRQLKKRTEELGFEADFFSLAKTPARVRETARAA
jgi:hypothetical protein